MSSALVVTPAQKDLLEPKDCYKIPQLVKEPEPWYKQHRKKTYELGTGELTFQFKSKQLVVYKKTW